MKRVSNKQNVLKRLAGSEWGCARSTPSTTYKMFIQPIMLYCCEIFKGTQPSITTNY
ncbi:unnamed protein product [Rodentolepis nana]|uniref:Uncharacterized protein n=1 Tax=Rodentolepis nana TaxID=102285 RepID=A0A0R3TKS2_RODNA|nr:unnamed protein product [Rodentolepis nana]